MVFSHSLIGIVIVLIYRTSSLKSILFQKKFWTFNVNLFYWSENVWKFLAIHSPISKISIAKFGYSFFFSRKLKENKDSKLKENINIQRQFQQFLIWHLRINYYFFFSLFNLESILVHKYIMWKCTKRCLLSTRHC